MSSAVICGGAQSKSTASLHQSKSVEVVLPSEVILWVPTVGSFLDMSHWEKTLEKSQNSLEG